MSGSRPILEFVISYVNSEDRACSMLGCRFIVLFLFALTGLTDLARNFAGFLRAVSLLNGLCPRVSDFVYLLRSLIVHTACRYLHNLSDLCIVSSCNN